jgi:predicted lipoprotein with Yx(FWY)xxD motif
MRPNILGIGAVAAVLLGGCGAGSTDPRADAAVMARTERTSSQDQSGREPVERPSKTARVRLEDSDYGAVLFDGKGGALYLFTADERGTSTCYGACAKAWPPFIVEDGLRAGEGVDRGLLGITRRRGGRRQVTYAGQPLYYYVHDTPHEIFCHDVYEFGGDWLVIQASGDPAP